MRGILEKKGPLGSRNLLAVALATIWASPALAAINCSSQVVMTGGATETCADLTVDTTNFATHAVSLTGPGTTLNVTNQAVVSSLGGSSIGVLMTESSIVNLGALPATIETSGAYSHGVSVMGDVYGTTRGGGHIMIGSPVLIDPATVAAADSFVTLSSGSIKVLGEWADGINATAGDRGKAHVMVGEAGTVGVLHAGGQGVFAESESGEASAAVLGSVRSAGRGVELVGATKAQLTVGPKGKIEASKQAVTISSLGEVSITNSGLITSSGSHAIGVRSAVGRTVRIDNAGEIAAIGNTTPGQSFPKRR